MKITWNLKPPQIIREAKEKYFKSTSSIVKAVFLALKKSQLIIAWNTIKSFFPFNFLCSWEKNYIYTQLKKKGGGIKSLQTLTLIDYFSGKKTSALTDFLNKKTSVHFKARFFGKKNRHTNEKSEPVPPKCSTLQY